MAGFRRASRDITCPIRSWSPVWSDKTTSGRRGDFRLEMRHLSPRCCPRSYRRRSRPRGTRAKPAARAPPRRGGVALLLAARAAARAEGRGCHKARNSSVGGATPRGGPRASVAPVGRRAVPRKYSGGEAARAEQGAQPRRASAAPSGRVGAVAIRPRCCKGGDLATIKRATSTSAAPPHGAARALPFALRAHRHNASTPLRLTEHTPPLPRCLAAMHRHGQAIPDASAARSRSIRC